MSNILRAALLLSLTFSASVALAQRNYSEGGYGDRRSVVAGGTIALHIATSRGPTFDVEIVNLATPSTVLARITGLSSQTRDCTGMWENGCNWPVTAAYTVPSGFTPGFYAARFPTSGGNRHILFVVKPAVLGSYAPIALIHASHSDLAYNRFGGKSVYDTISDNGQRAHIVSMNRPYFDDAGLARYNIWEGKFVNWMKSEARPFEVITDDEMEAGVDLSNYKALLIVGHSEYWSLPARQHLEAYSRSGKHIAIFGANTMWWQVRVDQQARKMTVYKSAQLDPMTGVDNDVVTTNWYDWPVLNNENTILGASFVNAGYVNKLDSYERVPVADRVPYTVHKAQHWALAGTGLSNGAEMGRSVGAIEVDGALFNTLPNGELESEGSDGTPLSYEVLATLPSSEGYATIGMYSNAQGGAVFNGAARDWPYGLVDDPIIQRITENVLDRFVTGAPFAYAPRVTPNRAEDLFNTPRANANYLPGWRYYRSSFEITPGCAHEGPSGVHLVGGSWTQVLRNLSVGRMGLSSGAANFWVNADLLTQTPAYPVPLLSFVDYRGPSYVPAAAVEIMMRPQGRSIRLTSFDGTAVVATTNWVVLAPGWQSVQFSWASPGTMQLNVSGTKVSVFNSKSGQKLTALVLEFAGSKNTGSVCVDQLQFRDAFAEASASTSTITASPSTVATGGASAIVVRLHDGAGHPLVNGGDSVTLSATLGAISPVTSGGDGTYAATFTAGSTGGVATISGTVNGSAIQETASIIVSGPPAPPSDLVATPASATRVDLVWTDNASGETSFRVERCTGAGCTNFALLTTRPANSTTHGDVTVAGATTYVYRVIAVNPTGNSVPSNTASATTPAECVPPAVSSHPQSTTITTGNSANLTVTATGTSLSYQWFAGTTPISGADGSSITVSPTSTTNYFVRVTNSCGTADSSTATVTVCTPPSVTTQPQSQSITSGASATLTVAATGTSLSYQWFAGASAIDGANSSSITVSPAATTSYFVRIVNSCGSVDSLQATVTVAPPANAGSLFYVLTPCRILDSRGPVAPYGGPAIADGATRVIQMTGPCGIPAGTTAVAVNVTVVRPPSDGSLAFYRTGTDWLGTSTVSYRTGMVRATSSIIALSANGQATVLNRGALTHFIVDVTGYFR